MPSIIRTLEQETMWYGEDGFPYVIEEMDQDHRLNVVAFLLRRAHQLFKQKIFHELYVVDHGDLLPRQIEEVVRSKVVAMRDPETWLEERPLLIALRRAIRNHNTVDGEVVDVPETELKELER